MGTHVEFEFGPSRSAAQMSSRGVVAKRRSLVWWVFIAFALTAAAYAIGVEQIRRDEYRRATVGKCFKTGIGAVGMAIDTAGTGSVWLMFMSGLKNSYSAGDLVETACPSTSDH